MSVLKMSRPFRRPSGEFFIRVRVPNNLQAVAGKQLYSKPLGTKDEAEARRRWPAARVAYESEAARWQRKANRVVLTPEQAQDIAEKWAVAEASGAIPFVLTPQSGADGSNVGLTAATSDKCSAVSSRIAAQAEQALGLAGISVTPAGWVMLTDAMAAPVAHARLQAKLRVWAGEPCKDSRMTHHPASEAPHTHLALNPADGIYTSPVPTVPQAPTQDPAPCGVDNSICALLAAWRKTTAAKPRTVAETEYEVRKFTAFLGHGDAGQVTKADGQRWRAECLSQKLTNNTFNNRLSMVVQVLEVGVRDGLLPVNPLTGLRLPKSKVAQRFPYTDEQAVQILSAARRETSPALRWSHWIMAFTGMRVAEVLQLTEDDIRRDGPTGIHYIAVHEADPSKSVKNGQARSVPIHPALIGEGLMDYVKGLKPRAPLFPEKELDCHGQRGGRGWNLVGKWVRSTVGIKDIRVAPNHSWRHRMEDEMRAIEVPEEVRDAILGHARQTTGRLYGVRGEALSRLDRELRKVPSPMIASSERTVCADAA